jgi:CheY-like chemotaxis protein/chromosome segregation ATPase
MPKLSIKRPSDGIEVTYAVTAERLTVGRLPDNTLQIADATVSGHHAELIAVNGHYVLRDLDSTNHTFVDDELTTEAALKNACRLRFGTVECDFNPNGASQPDAQVSSQLAAAQSRIDELEHERDAIRHEADESKAALETERERAASLTEDNDRIRTRAEELAAKLAEVEQTGAGAAKARAELQTKIDELGKVLVAAQMRIGAVAKERNATRAENQKLADELDAQQQQLAALTEQGERSARASEHMSAQLADAATKSAALAQERDAARQQAEELSATLRDTLAQAGAAGSERDAIGKRHGELAGEISSLQKQAVSLATERDEFQQTIDQLSEQLASLREENGHLAHDRAASHEAVERLQRELDEERQQLGVIGGERYALAQANHELGDELAKHRCDAAALAPQLEAAQRKAAELAIQAEKDRAAIHSLRAERDSLTERHNELTAQIAGDEKAAATLETALETSKQAAAKISAELQEARARLAAFAAVREVLGTEKSALSEAVAEAHTRLELTTKRCAELEAQREKLIGENAVLSKQLEDAEKLIFQFNVDLPKRNREIARLKKIANSLSSEIFLTANPGEAEAEHGSAPAAETDAASGSPANLVASDIATTPRAIAEPGSDEYKTARESVLAALGKMRRCLHFLVKNPDDLNLLHELLRHADKLSGPTAQAGFFAVHKVVAALHALLRDLYSLPEQVNPHMLRTASQALDFVAALLDEYNLHRARELPPGRVLVVDDDPDLLGAIVASLEMAGLESSGIADPQSALATLRDSPFDLIFLDMGLPQINGLDVCTEIRLMPHHPKTPIVFITGMATVSNWMQSSLNGANDFIAKPLSLSELGVKALSWTLKGQLGLL